MTAFKEFKVGDKVSILADRIENWQPTGKLTIARVHRNRSGQFRGAGHPQMLTMTNGQTYSGWWFDPAAVCHWARDTTAMTSHQGNCK